MLWMKIYTLSQKSVLVHYYSPRVLCRCSIQICWLLNGRESPSRKEKHTLHLIAPFLYCVICNSHKEIKWFNPPIWVGITRKSKWRSNPGIWSKQRCVCLWFISHDLGCKTEEWPLLSSGKGTHWLFRLTSRNLSCSYNWI
jgi:hypothetical protein